MRDIIETKLENAGIQHSKFARLSDDELFAYFCEVFSLKAPVVQTVVDTEMLRENSRMRDELKALYGVDKPFICGVAGDVQEDKLNEYILVCPAYGADGFAMYKKYKHYSAPEY
jgi:hypothetical protein